MADEVGICNSALSKIGATRIVSLTEGSKNANFCAEQLAKLRDQLLRRHLWNFAKARALLPRLSEAPVFGFDHQYQLPADWLRSLSLHDNDAGSGAVAYRIEGRRILSDASELYLVYIRQVTDPNQMTADFREALAFLLAKEAAIPIAQSNSLKQDMKEELIRALRQVRSTDAIEDFPEALPEGSWAAARHGGRVGGRG